MYETEIHELSVQRILHGSGHRVRNRDHSYSRCIYDYIYIYVYHDLIDNRSVHMYIGKVRQGKDR